MQKPSMLRSLLPECEFLAKAREGGQCGVGFQGDVLLLNWCCNFPKTRNAAAIARRTDAGELQRGRGESREEERARGREIGREKGGDFREERGRWWWMFWFCVFLVIVFFFFPLMWGWVLGFVSSLRYVYSGSGRGGAPRDRKTDSEDKETREQEIILEEIRLSSWGI